MIINDYRYLCLKKNYEDAYQTKGVSSKKAYQELVKYLDQKGCKMPAPFYKYKLEDKKTHRFLEGKIVGLFDAPTMKYTEVLNPDFVYDHILPKDKPKLICKAKPHPDIVYTFHQAFIENGQLKVLLR